jgi:hypothetical protein
MSSWPRACAFCAARLTGDDAGILAAPALVCSRRGEAEFFENLTFETRGIPGLAIIPSIQRSIHSFIHPSIYLSIHPHRSIRSIDQHQRHQTCSVKICCSTSGFPLHSFGHSSPRGIISISIIFIFIIRHLSIDAITPITQTHQYHDHYPVSVFHSTFAFHRGTQRCTLIVPCIPPKYHQHSALCTDYGSKDQDQSTYLCPKFHLSSASGRGTSIPGFPFSSPVHMRLYT